VGTLMTTVDCSQCGAHTALVPRNAPDFVPFALCPNCSLASYDQEQEWATIRAVEARNRAARITAAWDQVTPTHLAAYPVPERTLERMTAAADARAALVVYGDDPHTRASHLWAYARLLGERGLAPAKVARGFEADTLAAATTADFKDIKAIHDAYLGNRYKAVMIDGVGQGRFLNPARRTQEWDTLARSILGHNQLPLLGIAHPAPQAVTREVDKHLPFSTYGDPDLVGHIGINPANLMSAAMRALSHLLVLDT
jgi:hypothetical protein